MSGIWEIVDVAKQQTVTYTKVDQDPWCFMTSVVINYLMRIIRFVRFLTT